ncbi:SDR family oxidoreductase [Streptomyces sp. DSM 44917]|uniref:SDR family oxidoreductase n=1 Tax=Streptomyces boetiae TaxID=3075541 RepID=A0ABU2L393_9ACTN|nr:SDR family oxidoreductase [Streptomyces sp. DSM 44917]MDT0305876.1 SDR family oxidoreductase [Streptomyces sp. DSM 44917]
MSSESGVRRRTVPSGGLDLAVYEQGPADRPTVVLVHGYPDTHRVWDDVAADLAADHHVVRYDVRGAGASGRPSSRAGYRLDQLARDLFAVIEATSPGRPAHVVAHDWGSVQSWEAVTDREAPGRIASFTTMSGPCLDHVGHWMRERVSRPTPRHLAQLAGQGAHSWYIGAFHVPVLAPAVWRLVLGRNWGTVLRRLEGVTPREGHPQKGLAGDAVRGMELYRANMLPRAREPRRRTTPLPVQLIVLTKDRYVRPALTEGLERWAPRLWRRSLRASHWSALLRQGPTVARMVREFVAHQEGGPAAPELERARVGRPLKAVPSSPSSSPSSSSGPFAGKLAVVTGAGSGIGRATALAFAEQGAQLALCDIDLASAERTAELARLLGARADAWRVDVADAAAVDTFAAEVAAALGVPDIVVNNAGIGHSGSFLETTPKEWQRVLDVNLWGVINGSRAFGALLKERGTGGHIVNVASAAGYLPSRMLAAYATSKAAVLMLSDCLRAEVASAGIGVSAICPGIVNTNITRTTTFSGLDAEQQAARQRRFAGMYARRNYPPEKVAAQILRAVRTGRAVVPVTPEAKVAHALTRLSPGLLRRAARFRVG